MVGTVVGSVNRWSWLVKFLMCTNFWLLAFFVIRHGLCLHIPDMFWQTRFVFVRVVVRWLWVTHRHYELIVSRLVISDPMSDHQTPQISWDAKKLYIRVVRCQVLWVSRPTVSRWLHASSVWTSPQWPLTALPKMIRHPAAGQKEVENCGGSSAVAHRFSEDLVGDWGSVSVSDELQLNWTQRWNVHVMFLRNWKRQGGVKKLFSRDHREDCQKNDHFSCPLTTWTLIFWYLRENVSLLSYIYMMTQGCFTILRKNLNLFLFVYSTIKTCLIYVYVTT